MVWNLGKKDRRWFYVRDRLEKEVLPGAVVEKIDICLNPGILSANMHAYLLMSMMSVSTDDMDYDGESGTGYSRGSESKGSQSYHFTQQQLSNQQVITVIFNLFDSW